jgi:hypothetical protein
MPCLIDPEQFLARPSPLFLVHVAFVGACGRCSDATKASLVEQFMTIKLTTLSASS